jgi:putative hemolysin
VNSIDIESIIAQKRPTLSHLLPSFVINKLRAMIHEAELNRGLAHIGDIQGLDFVDAVIAYFGLNLQVWGRENIPCDERMIVVANHPLGGLDGLALMSVIGQIRKDLLFLVNDILMHFPNLQPLFLPVDKHGSNRKYHRVYQRVFASQTTLLHFPAGLCSRKRGHRIQDVGWHKSFVTIAQRYQRSILPVYIEGANSSFFYQLANIRERLRIRFNVEMLWLVDEMFKQRNTTLPLWVGQPIPHQALHTHMTPAEWTETIRHTVYGLKAD